MAQGGFGKILNRQVMGQETFGYNPDLRPYEFDVAKARQLMAQAGYPNGFQVTFAVTSVGRVVAEPIQAMWRQIGVVANTERPIFADLERRFVEGRQYPLQSNGTTVLPLFDADPAFNLYSKESR